ncbi:MAG: formyl transferase [Proteobacteria bacterium]|nr:formyl transferase [Pseudomonadota bacterium]
MNIAYFGYDFFWPCLSKLIERGHSIQSVFTFGTDNKYNYNDRVIQLSSTNNIPVRFDRIRKEDLTQLRQSGCELLVSAAYPFRIPLAEDSIHGINIHPTLLPFGRGPWPLPHLIIHSPDKAGVTIHKLSEAFDSGDILAQQGIEITSRETLESLSARTQILATNLLASVLDDFEGFWKKSTPQGDGSYWPMPTDAEQTIDWSDSVYAIDRKVRAFGKFDTNAVIGESKFFVYDVSVWQETHNFQPGTLIHEMNRETVVAASDGFVCIRFCEPVKE